MNQPTKTKDLTGIPCPMSFVKVKLALHEIQPGETIQIELDSGEVIENVIASCDIENIPVIAKQTDKAKPCFITLQKPA